MRPIADALVFVHCAHTSLAVLERCGMLDREKLLYQRLFPLFGKVAVVSYGDQGDLGLGSQLAPEMLGRVWTVCNDRRQEPGVFMAGVPDRVARLVEGCRRVLVLTDQHYGGDVGVCIARALRGGAGRHEVGLVARGGYHWSWFVAREQGADSQVFAQSRFLESELVHAADVVIGTTQRMLDDLALMHSAPAGKLRLVPNYIQPPSRAAGSDAREPGFILSAGRLHPQKRFDLLMRAAAALPATVRERARVLILGQGPEETALRALANSLPVRIEIRPRVPHGELMGLMARCAVYAQCSAYEGHPKTIIEALGAGCAVLVTDGPGVSEAVESGMTGLIARGDAASVARGLERLLSDAALARQLGERAAAVARQDFGIEHTFPRYVQACEDAMALAGRGGTMPPTSLRWDPPMLNLAAADSAQMWAGGIAAFAKRLDGEKREEFLARLEGAMAGTAVASAR